MIKIDSLVLQDKRIAITVKERKVMEEKIIDIENMQIKELDSLKEKYLEVKMPEEQLDKLKLAIEKGKMDNRRERRKIARTRFAASAAAVIAAIIILPNTSPSVAYAMEKVPLLGNLVKLVTWRDYQYGDERHQADVKVEKLEIAKGNEEAAKAAGNRDENANAEDSRIAESMDTMESVGVKNTEEVLKNSMEEINVQIEEITNQLIEEFEAHMQEEMGYQDLVVKSEVVADSEKYFTLKLLCYQGAGSGYAWNYYYTIDMMTGERLQLKDLFEEGTDYITVISEEIKKQMREQMETDENVYYWLEDEIEEWNFETITEDTLFYLNEEEQLVISFNEGDVAPMYMGVVEFVIPKEVVKDILR